MNRKLDFLSKYDENLTIAQLKQAVVEEERKSAEKEQEEIQEVKDDFQKRYFRYLDEDSIFGGRELNIFEFKTLKSFEKSIDWEFIYYFNGKKISFSDRELYLIDVSHLPFTAKKLRKMTEITKEEYNQYLWKYNRITTELKSIMG
jgi:hypothetical protein